MRLSLLTVTVFSSIAFFSGCALKEYRDQISLLRQLSASQADIGQYLQKQEALFRQLVLDLETERLVAGVSKQEVITRYGEPVLARRYITEDKNIAFKLLYRAPNEYFHTTRVYLYFDAQDELFRWEYRQK